MSKEVFAYDINGRKLSAKLFDYRGTLMSTTMFTYDADGKLISWIGTMRLAGRSIRRYSVTEKT